MHRSPLLILALAIAALLLPTAAGAQTPPVPIGTIQGQAQTLDHKFVSPWLAREVEHVRVAHVNADWPKDFPGDEARGASDHDPVVTRYLFAPGAGG